MLSRRFLPAVVVLCAVATVLAACTTPPAPRPVRRDTTQLVLALPSEPSSLNPLLGYGDDGAAKIFDGLVEHQPDGSLRPALAADLPQPSADDRSWTVPVRAGVKFTDGTTLGADDVVATYRALLDPAFGSPLRARFDMLTDVEQVGPNTVKFDLAYPYPAFPDLLVLGILPRAALAHPAPLAALPISDKPVGTGPYELVDWVRGQRIVLQANDAYFGGAPKIKKVTVLFVPDATTRANRVHSGDVDGALVSPADAKAFDNVSGYRVLTDRSAEYRMVSLPVTNPVTADPVIRQVLNLAVNRQGMVDRVLAGKGEPASTPFPSSMPEFLEPQAVFHYDRAEATKALDAAGWVPGPDDIRSRAGLRAAFTLLYAAGDTVDAQLAQAFAADAKVVGIDVQVTPASPDVIGARLGADAALLGGGDPFDPDLQAYRLLHSSPSPGPGTVGTGPVDPGGYADPKVDAALDAGRHASDPAARATAYRAAQRAYIADPGMVFLAFLAHTVVQRTDWSGYQEVVDGPDPGMTWGPWWNLQVWTP